MYTRGRIDDLNDTLLELIFKRLSPLKYLIRSKCVSRRWNSIISRPDFMRTLTKEHYLFTFLLRHVHDFGGSLGQCVFSEHPHFRKNELCLDFFPTDIDYWYAPNCRVVDIVAQNNDVLVTCRVLIKSRKVHYCIANLLTKQYVLVPLLYMNIPTNREEYCRVGIAGFVDGVSSAVTPTSNNNTRGFRIVRVIEDQPTLVIQIYSSETGQWTTYSFDNYFDIQICVTKFRQTVTLNNKVHWLMPSKILVVDPFNIDIVPPYTLDLPNKIDYDSSVLDVCQNRLRISHIHEKQGLGDYHPWEKQGLGDYHPRLQVWEVLNDYNDNDNDNDNDNNDHVARVAILRLVIDLPLKTSIPDLPLFHPYLPKNHESYYGGNKVICCHPNDPNVVYICNKQTLYSYDVQEESCKVVSDCTGYWNERFVFLHPLQ